VNITRRKQCNCGGTSTTRHWDEDKTIGTPIKKFVFQYTEDAKYEKYAK
jgi:hypothetical protein